MTKDLTEIRNQTRLALPMNDAYLYRLGIALYGFASINSFMIETICHIDNNQDKIRLLNERYGRVIYIFRQTFQSIKSENSFPEIHKTMWEIADLFEGLTIDRADFVHSYPITNNKNEQILHRRKDSAKKYFEVDNDFLDNFISRLDKVSAGLYEIKGVIRRG